MQVHVNYNILRDLWFQKAIKCLNGGNLADFKKIVDFLLIKKKKSFQVTFLLFCKINILHK